MRHRIVAVFFGLFCAAAPSGVSAQVQEQPSWKQRLTVKPVVFDSSDDNRNGLGLDYDYLGTYSRAPLPRTSVGNDEFTVDDFERTKLSYAMAQVTARGSIAASKERNPNKLVDFRADGLYVWDSKPVTAQLSAVLKFETDQGLDDKQYMYGVSAAATKRGLLRKNQIGTVILSFGSVNPRQDAERKRLLGTLDNYRRWELEATTSFGLPENKMMRSIDLGLRAFKEMNPPAEIAAAELDRHRWGVVRLNLKNDMFIQYSRGSLPFDQRSTRAIKAGWALQLE